jgi:C-terminal processing protease CtpA/Prc
VFDLRDNTGGSFWAGRATANAWIRKGKIFSMSVADRSGAGEGVVKRDVMAEPRRYRGLDKYPLVAIINDVTGSISEWTLKALQDHSLVTVVGDRSAGKDVGQKILKVSGGIQYLTNIRKLHPDTYEPYENFAIVPDIDTSTALGHLSAQGANDYERVVNFAVWEAGQLADSRSKPTTMSRK